MGSPSGRESLPSAWGARPDGLGSRSNGSLTRPAWWAWSGAGLLPDPALLSAAGLLPDAGRPRDAGLLPGGAGLLPGPGLLLDAGLVWGGSVPGGGLVAQGSGVGVVGLAQPGRDRQGRPLVMVMVQWPWCTSMWVRHEALLIRVEVGDLRRCPCRSRAVKLRAA